MSLLNSVLGAVLSKGLGGGGGNSQQDLIGSVIGGLLQQGGGAGGVLDAFRKAGHAQEADSWQGTGQNMPIGGADMMKVLGGLLGGGAAAQQGGGGLGDVLGGVLGGGQSAAQGGGGLGGLLGGVLAGGQQAQSPGGMGGLEQILAQSGMDQNQFGDLLAKALPQVLDGMTPNGQVEANQTPDMMQSVLSGVLGRLGK
jgi:uncharacterized protein YidB (DUF937 family)